MPALTYSVSAFTPFTKIRSADVNTKFTDIATLLNTTGLDDTNLQNAGITRATKLKTGTANAVVINAPSTGVMSELAPVNNGAVYFNGSGVPSAGALPTASGGTGVALTPAIPGDVIRVDATGLALELGATPVPPPVKLYNFNRFA